MNRHSLRLGLRFGVPPIVAAFLAFLPPAMTTAQQPKGRPAAKADDAPQIEPERHQFRSLILGNPNYFGNLPGSTLKPVVTTIKADTSYEQIGCVGYQPQFKRLEAVVFVNKTAGYGGGLCSNGSKEYVRFYVDWNNDGDWADAGEDMGLSGFTAYDLPVAQRKEYDVTLQITPRNVTFCSKENLPKVRAILSWNAQPPPNTPGFVPVWGEVQDARIQIDPRRIIILKDLFQDLDAKIPPHLGDVVDVTKPLPVEEPKALELKEAAALYKGTDVPPHRFALAHVQQLIDQPQSAPNLQLPASKGLLTDLGLDLGAIIGQIQKTSGNTSFEQLECVGLNTNDDTLVGAHGEAPKRLLGRPVLGGQPGVRRLLGRLRRGFRVHLRGDDIGQRPRPREHPAGGRAVRGLPPPEGHQ